MVIRRKRALVARPVRTLVRAGTRLAPVAALLAACGGSESALEVIYQTWNADLRCYQTCGTVSPPAELGVSDTCDAEPSTCDIVPGETILRVIALYDNVRFDDPLSAPPPVLTAYVDGVEWAGGTAEATDWIPHRRNAHEAWFETNRPLPYVSGASLWFRVQAATDFFEDSVRFTLHAPALSVAVTSCADTGDCQLPAGLGSAKVVIEGPGYLDTPLTVWQRLDGLDVAGSEQEVTLESGGSGSARAELAFPVPGDISSIWQIVARTADLEAGSAPIQLRQPRNIELAISPTEPTLETADFGSNPTPERSAGDLDTCRQLYVAVQTPDIPTDGLVALSTSFGDLDGMAPGNPIDVPVDANGFATAMLTWEPAADGARTVQVTASAEGLSTRVLTFDLEPVYPASTVLLPPPGNVQVTGSGSEETTLTGWFVPPQGATLLPDVEAWLVVGARAAEMSGSLPCGAPMPVAYLQCDPGRLTGSDAGGCLLTPDGLTAGADGTFNITLASGVCFVGNVDITLYGYEYLDSEGCLGGRDISDSPSVLAEITVEYEAAADSVTPTPMGGPTPTPTPPSGTGDTPTPGVQEPRSVRRS